LSCDHSKDQEFAAQWLCSQKALTAFVLSAVPSFHDAEDVIQKVAMTAFKIRHQYSPEASQFTTWVIGIARNEIMHWRRSQQRSRLILDTAALDMLANAAIEMGSQHSEVYEALHTCLRHVRGRGRAMLQMRYYESMGSSEIARRFNTSASVVDVTLSRVRKALLRCIGSQMGRPDAT